MTLRDDLAAEALAVSPLQRREITYPDLESWIGGKIDAYAQVFIGGNSVTIMDTKEKLLTYDEFPATNGELARVYLKRVWQGSRSIYSGAKASGWEWEAPLYCSPVRNRNLAYIDVTAAWWQVVSTYRPDDIPLPSGHVVPGELEWPDADELAADKALRHAVVGAMFAHRLRFFRYGAQVDVHAPSPWASPALKRQCMATYHAIAGAIRDRFTLHAWLSDAAVVDACQAEEVCDWLAITWGIRSRVVEVGMGSVWSCTQYMVGQKWTMDFVHETATPLRAVERPLDKIRKVPTEPLRAQRLSRL